MDPPELVQHTRDITTCPRCMESRTILSRNPRHERNLDILSSTQTLRRPQSHTQWHPGRLIKSALNLHRQLFIHVTLLVTLLSLTGLVDASCTTGEPFVGYLPTVPDDQLKLQHATSATDCAETCCLKKYCDLAWIVDQDCFHGRCHTENDCIPFKDASVTSIVYVMDRSTQTYEEESGVSCRPYDKWDTCPVGEHCDQRSHQCQCDDGRTRNFMTNRCEDDQKEPWDTGNRGIDDSAKHGNRGNDHGQTYNPENPYRDISDGGPDAPNNDVGESFGTHDSVGESGGIAPSMDKFRFCESDEVCEPYGYCFGLQRYGAGICKCHDGFHESEAMGMCVPDDLEEGELITQHPVSPTDKLLPTGGSENAPAPTYATPDMPQETLPETPLAEPPSNKPDIARLVTQITPGAENETEGDDGGGGAKEAEVGGLKPGDGIDIPHKKNDGVGFEHKGDLTATENGTKTNPEGDDSMSPTPLSDTPTKEGGTQSNTGLDELTEKTLVTDSKTQTPSLPTPSVVKLTVSAGEDRTLQLPDQDHVNLIAYVIPENPPKGQGYTYDWEVLDGPEDQAGKMTGEHAKQLRLEELSAGVYKFKIEVWGEGSYGSATVNVTVLAPPRVNQPPKAVINPPSQEIILPNPGTYLDGSDSTDDDDIVSYHWQEIEGPVRETKITGDGQTLQLTDLVPGPYVIRLTVTDSDGVTDSALANVTVKEEIDNPPVAKAGKDVIIKLPVNSAVLYGNGSFDDHPGMVYEWSKDSGPVADMSGSSSPIFHLNNLEEGTYIFRLTVTDSKGRKDSDEATVIVKPENNVAPTADAGPDKELSLPDDSTTLDGTKSTDDLEVTSYHWQIVSGPNDPDIKDADKATAVVSGLVAGRYVFQLTVGDIHEATDTDTVDVVVKKEFNNPPVAHAGPDITINLPNNVVELDGSQSTDDKGIVSYEWKRDAKSPAAGMAVGNSAHEALLTLTGLVAGTYHMKLNVTDAKGASSTDTAVITVVKDSHRLNLVVLTFDVQASKFTQQDKVDMVRSLAVLLSVRDEDVKIQQVYQTPNEQLQVIFYATNSTSNAAMPGPKVVKILTKKKLSSETDLLKFRVLEMDTMVCQKNCSGHGQCDPYTKQCICESFWMENYFRTWMGDKESNCDWSILYVIIVVCVIVVGIGGLCWICICCIKRSRRKVKRRRRYNLLSQDLDGTESMEMLPKNANGSVLDKLTDKGSFQGKQSSSIMISESDDDTDEETTLFDSKKRQGKNGKANGSVMSVQPRKKRPFPLISSRTEKLHN